jgi:hypothetical protein
LSKKSFAGNLALKIDIKKAFDTLKIGFNDIFCIVEDVLSRRISKALDDGDLIPMTLCRKVQVPTHVLYADNIMIFCKGSKKNIKCLLQIFQEYADISGQLISAQKSKFYAGSIANSRLLMITNLLGFGLVLFLSTIWDAQFLLENRKHCTSSQLQIKSKSNSSLGRVLIWI